MSKGVELLLLKARKAEKQGLRAEAEAIYRSILSDFPKNARAQQELARLSAPATAPTPSKGAVDALIALYNQRRMAEVVERGEQLAATAPGSVLLFDLLGTAQAALGQFDLSAKAFARAVALKPGHHAGHYNLGNALQQQGKLAEAIASYGRALALKPDYADALNALGVALEALGKPNEAANAYARAVALAPDHRDAHANLGNALLALERLEDAVASYTRAVAVVPGKPEIHRSLGIALQGLGKLDEAAASYRRALALRPDYADAYSNLGNLLQDQGRLDEAVATHIRAVALQPASAGAHNNLGAALQELGRIEEAAASYARAVALKPDYAEARWNLALLDLLRGDFVAGWPGYEWRKRKQRPTTSRSFAQPLWLGEEDLNGKAVFLHHEQGLGDTLQFVRYARLVRDRGARVTVSVQRPLLPILSQALAGINVLADGAVPGRFDYHAPLMSLPLAFRTRLDTVPAPVPYVFAEADRRERWAERLGQGGFKIGICWQGAGGKAAPGRSFPLALFSGIAALPDTRLISLQKGEGEGQLASLPAGMKVEALGDFDAEGAAFLDTAAVMAECDLVITCDTAVAHLAGAMGVPAWVMLKRVPDWRWLLDRDECPWYPTMRLYRQDRPGDWSAAFAKAERDLAGILAFR